MLNIYVNIVFLHSNYEQKWEFLLFITLWVRATTLTMKIVKGKRRIIKTLMFIEINEN